MIHSEEPNACLARELACPDSDRGGAGRRDCGLPPVRDGAQGGDHIHQGREPQGGLQSRKDKE